MGGKPGFRSSHEVFEASQRLVSALRAGGCPEGAAIVEEGLSGVNGLTDGWAFFLARLEKADGLLPDSAIELRKGLRVLIAAARYAVYR